MGIRYPFQHAVSATARFTVGQDHHGWWVVKDRLGRVGGLFANEAAALHFASEESNRDAHEICCAPKGKCVELEGVTIGDMPMNSYAGRAA